MSEEHIQLQNHKGQNPNHDIKFRRRKRLKSWMIIIPMIKTSFISLSSLSMMSLRITMLRSLHILVVKKGKKMPEEEISVL